MLQTVGAGVLVLAVIYTCGIECIMTCLVLFVAAALLICYAQESSVGASVTAARAAEVETAKDGEELTPGAEAKIDSVPAESKELTQSDQIEEHTSQYTKDPDTSRQYSVATAHAPPDILGARTSSELSHRNATQNHTYYSDALSKYVAAISKEFDESGNRDPAIQPMGGEVCKRAPGTY